MLTDLEICKRIAEIEDVLWMLAYPNTDKEFVGLINGNDLTGTPPELIGEYNPLTDKALCFDLMLTHRVSVLDCGSRWEASIDYIADVGIMSPDETCCYYTEDEDLHRAVCLAIILKDDKE